MAGARYVVGIDLGTTNCAVAYVDTKQGGDIRPLPIPQVVAPGEVEPRPTLPSFLLLPGPHEVQRGALALPWRDDPGWCVGAFARDRGAELPHRLVASAKSWLCNAEVDLTEPILPWRSQAARDEDDGDGGERVSPIEAAARYLGHIRAAWDHAFPDAPLAEQDVLVTVPASFDAVATDLTARAARHAGLGDVTLLEEPQAAFYAWLAASGDSWRERLHAGDVVLVVDIGGGTTDFSLIAVADDGGALALERVAVGDHILLGGDNIDLALAHLVAQRLGDKGRTLSAKQRGALVHACRRAKEQLLADGGPDAVPIAVLGGGSKLIGGTLRAELTRADVDVLVVDGFFPPAALGDAPRERTRMGLGEVGLPYAADPAITRHLAHFLARHDRRPTAILFNGGVMQSGRLRARVTEIASGWFGGDPLPALAGTDLDLAVAHGAAYYGLVRRGDGVRIRGGLGRTYYIGIETAMPAIPGFEPPVHALCVAPFGLEEGSRVDLPDERFALVVGEPAEFRFFASTSRTDDRPGQVVEVDGDIVELAPIRTRLDPGDGHDAGARVPVSLSANVTELGALELWCVARDGSGRWKLEYNVRETER
ncbi:MAG: Hsp70 family protein [Deltaproteobacteria bacterium]|nr:MAG: Hsp70 family protein [Deltaproteobacteria bacterium]